MTDVLPKWPFSALSNSGTNSFDSESSLCPVLYSLLLLIIFLFQIFQFAKVQSFFFRATMMPDFSLLLALFWSAPS